MCVFLNVLVKECVRGPLVGAGRGWGTGQTQSSYSVSPRLWIPSFTFSRKVWHLNLTKDGPALGKQPGKLLEPPPVTTVNADPHINGFSLIWWYNVSSRV